MGQGAGPERISWWGLANLSCAQATRLDAARLDQRLLRRERLFLGVHLVLCRWCRRYHAQVRLVRRWVEAYCAGDGAGSVRLSAEARQRIARRLGRGVGGGG